MREFIKRRESFSKRKSLGKLKSIVILLVPFYIVYHTLLFIMRKVGVDFDSI